MVVFVIDLFLFSDVEMRAAECNGLGRFWRPDAEQFNISGTETSNWCFIHLELTMAT